MRRAIRFILATLPPLGAVTTPLAAQKVAVVEKRLGRETGPYSCGARARRQSAGGWVAHVGSSNECRGSPESRPCSST
jgi:hypothetical protein